MNFYDEIKAAYQEPPKEPKETLLNYDDRFTLQSLIGYLKHSALRVSAKGRTSFSVGLLTSNTSTALRYKDKKGEDSALNEGFTAQLLNRKHPKLQKEITSTIREALGPFVVFKVKSKPPFFNKDETVITLEVSWIHPKSKPLLCPKGDEYVPI